MLQLSFQFYYIRRDRINLYRWNPSSERRDTGGYLCSSVLLFRRLRRTSGVGTGKRVSSIGKGSPAWSCTQVQSEHIQGVWQLMIKNVDLSMIDEERSIDHDQSLRKFLTLQLSARSPVNHLHHCISFNRPNKHIHKLYAREAPCMRGVPPRESARFRFAFIHSFAFTYAPLTAEHFLRSWNESSKPRVSMRTRSLTISQNSWHNQN